MCKNWNKKAIGKLGETHMSEYAIRISEPRINYTDNTARLEADTEWEIDGSNVVFTAFFEVEKCWGEYLVSELSDAFVLALLELAMEKGCDIYYQAPMSEDLKYQLETYLIPAYAKYLEPFNHIKLIGLTSDAQIETAGVVGAGFSGGVDSFYSVLKHINSPYQSKRVTHLLLALNGAALMGISEEMDQKWFIEEKMRLQKAATELGLEFIAVNSNVSLVNGYKEHLLGGDSIPTLAFVHALRKLFGAYYWASGYEASVFHFETVDGTYMDMFALPMLSVKGLRFYLSGSEANRVEKVAYIADNNVAQNYLTVCAHPDSCGICSKCLRTMTELYSLGKLDLFDKVFDVEEYKRKFSWRLGREFALDHPPFTTDIKNSMVKNGVRVPISSLFLSCFIYKPYYFFKRKLRNNKLAQNLYYNHGWAERMGEVRPDEEIVKARLEGRGKVR